MSWNHRVIRTEDGHGEAFYAIHECFYDKKGDTLPTSWTEEATRVIGIEVSDLIWALKVMRRATEMPVLEIRDGKLVEVEDASADA